MSSLYNDINEMLKTCHESFDKICCVCTHSMEETQTKHLVEDMDGYTWAICDECWQRIKDIMDQEE